MKPDDTQQCFQKNIKNKVKQNQRLMHILFGEKVVKIHNAFYKIIADETIGRLQWILKN